MDKDYRVAFCNEANITMQEFTEEELMEIEDIFKAISFLYLCKKSAITLSREKWKQIENNLFVVE